MKEGLSPAFPSSSHTQLLMIPSRTWRRPPRKWGLVYTAIGKVPMARPCCVGWPHSPITPGDKVLEDATRDGGSTSVPHWCPMPELVMRKTSPFPAWGASSIAFPPGGRTHVVVVWAPYRLGAQMVTGVC